MHPGSIKRRPDIARFAPMGREMYRARRGDAPQFLGQLVAHAVSCAFLVPPQELRARTRRTASVARARQVAMYLAHVGLGLSYTDAGRLFGRDRTTVAHACRLVEDQREDPRFDASLDHLERALRARLDADVPVACR